MNTRIALITIALLTACPLWGAGDANHRSSDDQHETRLLQRLLQMEPHELAQLRQTIERIERMTPEEKERMQARIQQVRAMQPEQARALRDFYGALSEDEREQMRQNWRALSREERREWRQKLRDMSPEDRAEAFEKNRFLPVQRPEHEARKTGMEAGN